MFLLFLLLSPLIAILVIIFQKNEKNIFNFSIFFSFFIFLLSTFLWFYFDQSYQFFQFYYCSYWFNFNNITFCIGLDGISLFFIIITTFLIPISLLSSYYTIKENVKTYCILFFLLELCLLISFSILDFFFFFIFFEGVLIPMYLIIGKWGSRSRKMKASYYFFLYTFIGSLFMLITIMHLYLNVGTTNFLGIYDSNLSLYYQKMYWFGFFFSFAIKVPMFPFYNWLPEAHVEAPTSGSVILAGILLKLGSYGFLRILINFLPNATYFFSPIIFILSILSIFYASITAIRQTDLKKIIAYTSIVHMNMIMLAMFSLTVEGITGSLYQMVSHSIVSSALFLSVGMLYDRYHTRNIYYFSGLVHVMPLYSFCFLIYIMTNVGLPGTGGFIGELLILIGIFNESILMYFLSAFSSIITTSYLYLFYNLIFYGNLNITLKVFYDLTYKEFLIHFIFILIIIFMGLYPHGIISYIEPTVLKLVSHINFNIYMGIL